MNTTSFSRSTLNRLKQRIASIGAKIILPYLLLTMAVAGIGAFIVVRLVADTLQERFFNQLLDAGRIVSESMVDLENDRLRVLRIVTNTEGVAESLVAQDRGALAGLVPQIIANSTSDAVEIINLQGREVYGWQRPPNQSGLEGEARTGSDFSALPEINQILNGTVDAFGAKQAMLMQTPQGIMLFALGPIYQDKTLVGVAMVGAYLEEIATSLNEQAVAKVTMYDQSGQVLATTLGGGRQEMADLLREQPTQYNHILALLGHSSGQPVVSVDPETAVPLRQMQILGQEYRLAFGDWRLRNRSVGFYSVALPVKFVVTTTGVSRNWLSLLFSLATVAVFIIGYLVARRIIQPLNQLVHSSLAVAQGDLTQRTGIERSDEIGYLAHSFDVMTERLSERTRQLLEQASKLEAILDSTADGIIVLNQQASIITINPKARHILADAPDDFVESILQETTMPQVAVDDPDSSRAVALSLTPQTKRYRVNNRIFGALASPVKTPAGEVLGTVIALRDITREVEAEQLKDTFITNISHDLRTPLTSIRGYSDLLLKSANDSLNATQRQFLETINRNTQTLMQHVDEIIDITELQAGQLKLEQETVCFSDLIKALITKWQDPVAEKGLSLHTDLPTTPLYVQGDANRLRWAVENLLDNAYQYNLDAGKIIIVLQVVDHKIQLDITDTGIGVAPEDQPYLFTQFFRADNEQMYHVAGVGLGLFITRTLIELHQGQVWATSQPDLGSTFSVSLPQLEPQTTAILDQEQTLA